MIKTFGEVKVGELFRSTPEWMAAGDTECEKRIFWEKIRPVMITEKVWYNADRYDTTRWLTQRAQPDSPTINSSTRWIRRG